MKEIFDGLQTARRSSTRFVAAAKRRGFSPKEESLTDHLLSKLPADASVRTFTRAEENRASGADWLWWWTDGVEWFGSLVQAKRRLPGSQPYDFAYTPRASRRNPVPQPQIVTLLDAAAALGVPAVYALYNHGQLPANAHDLCGRTGGERPCTRLAVAAVPALVAQNWSGTGVDVAAYSKPIECLACPSNAQRISPYLAWCTTPQVVTVVRDAASLPRVVAAGLLQQVAEVRMGQLRSASGPPRSATISLGQGAVVTDVGDDMGHFSEPWVSHIMRGLRSVAPRWLAALAQGDAVEVDLPVGLAGVVIVHAPRVAPNG